MVIRARRSRLRTRAPLAVLDRGDAPGMATARDQRTFPNTGAPGRSALRGACGSEAQARHTAVIRGYRRSAMRSRTCRLLVTGASGAGTTTLGRALADHWSVPHADIDDYFWLPTSPPYTQKRPEEARLRLMSELFLPRSAWVLSGSAVGWGDPLLETCDAVVFLTLDAELRMRRLREREVARYGEVDEGAHRVFFEWARGYDDPTFAGRSLVKHERWLAATSQPVLRLDAAAPVPDLVDAVNLWLD